MLIYTYMNKDPAKKPIYKRWWFWAIIGVLLIAGIFGSVEKKKSVSETETISCDTIRENDPTIAKGEQEILQECIDGEKEVTYEIIYVNNDEKSKTKIAETIKKEKQDKIIKIGTREESALTQDNSANEAEASSSPTNVYYNNCSEVRSAGVSPIYSGQPGYRIGLDRDGDGVACE